MEARSKNCTMLITISASELLELFLKDPSDQDVRNELDRRLLKNNPAILPFTKESLKQKYPDLLGDVPLDISDGWLRLVDRICNHIEFMAEHNRFEKPKISQIKQKFGSLRCYIHYGQITPTVDYYRGRLDGWIESIQYESSSICEECGRAGSIREGSWIRILCDHCDMILKIKGKI